MIVSFDEEDFEMKLQEIEDFFTSDISVFFNSSSTVTSYFDFYYPDVLTWCKFHTNVLKLMENNGEHHEGTEENVVIAKSPLLF